MNFLSRSLSPLLLLLAFNSIAFSKANQASTGIQAEDPQESRAEEWKQRRREKGARTTRSQVSGLEKALLYVEGKGAKEIVTIRYKDFYPKFGQLSTGSGAAPGLRYFKSKIGGSNLTAESSAAFSFTGYKMGDFQFGHFNKMAPYFFLGPADFGAPFEFGEEQPGQVKTFLYGEARYRYFPREVFYGLGQDSPLEDRSDFLLEDGFYNISAGHQFNSWLAVGTRFGYLQVNTGRGGDEDFPDTQDQFRGASLPGLERQPDFLSFDTAIFLDYRDTPGDPHRGGALGFSYSRFDDRGGEQFEFNRFSLDSRGYLPLGSRQRILAIRFFGSWENADQGSQVPFFLQRTLGGKETLRGFREFRFRDSNLLHFSAEYRWEAAPAFETAIFYDTGKVYPDNEGLELDHLRKSIGIGFRFKTARKVLFRLDIARSEEGTRVHFQFGPSF